MAKIYPPNETNLYSKTPFSERILYDKLKKLSNDYVIFHSVKWLKKHSDRPYTWYENDYVILNKHKGMLVLEVKGGKISFIFGLVQQTNTETGESVLLDEGNDPLSQAERGLQYYRKLIKKAIKGIEDRFPMELAVCFPSCSIENDTAMPSGYSDIKNAIINANDLNDISACLDRIFDFYNVDNRANFTEEEFAKVCDIIAPTFDLIAAPSIIKDEMEQAFIRLTNEQSYLLDYISEQRVATIQGAAGTGKTLVALEAAKRFSNDNKRVLFLCFNSLLFEYLSHNCTIKNVDFYNISTFVFKHTGYDISTDELRFKHLQDIKEDVFNYDSFIIDEAQDFTDNEIEFFVALAELKEANLLIFYDKNQLSTTEKVADWIVKADCKLVLTKNCRNTNCIARTAYSVIDTEIKAKMSDLEGDKPSIAFINNKDLVSIGNIIKYFKDESVGYCYKDYEITILSMVPEYQSIMNNVHKISGIDISRELRSNNVFYTTAQKYKGLENKIIIITDIDESCFTDPKKKMIFYMACSRAAHRLILVIEGNGEKIRSISQCINDLPPIYKDKIRIFIKTQTNDFDNIV